MNFGQQTSAWKILLIFISVAIFLRFPFFFRDYIDRDESTFILMGQALVDGYLPYLKLWDLKPPLVFYFFAGIITIFGKSLIAIRLIACIIIGFTAFFTFKLSSEFFNRKISLISGFLSIYLLSIFGAMQGLMSEHLATLPLVMGLYYLIKNPNQKTLLTVGVLFGLAMMFRLNLAYAILFIQAYLVFQNKKISNGILNAIYVGMGSVILILVVISPYIITGNFNFLKVSVMDASLAYSDVSLKNMLKTLPFVISLLLICGLSIKFLKVKNYPHIMLLIVMILGQSFMFFKSGKINGHYLIQIYPFLVILVVALISKIPFKLKFQKYAIPLLIVLGILLPMETYFEWKNIIESKIKTGYLSNGEGFTIPRYLIENYEKEEYSDIFFLNEHIGYWMLDTQPPTAISTHPSNIFRPAAHAFVEISQGSPFNELKFILDQKPEFIVFDQKRNPVPREGEIFQLFNRTLESNYQLEKEFGNNSQVKLYKLKLQN